MAKVPRNFIASQAGITYQAYSFRHGFLSLLAQALFVLSIVLSATNSWASRSMHWNGFSVDAELDEAGQLHIIEKQSIVFDGSWNGGERTFRVEPGQRLYFKKLMRVDSHSGAAVELKEGDLSKVDNYAWTDEKTLRWRSRLPSDPPFSQAEMLYVLEYTYSHILESSNDAYVIDHDFAIPDRAWPIHNFSLTIRLAPCWSTTDSFKGSYQQPVLWPAAGFAIRALLHTSSNIKPYVREATGVSEHQKRPNSPGTSKSIKLFFVFLFALLIAVRTIIFIRHERSIGRYNPLLPISIINREWLKKHVFSYPPEVVGAAWDKATGAAEVTAIIARMVGEKKISITITERRILFFKKDILTMKLLVDRNSLRGYERELVDALFFDGDYTDSKMLKKQYSGSGFNPVLIIKDPLTQKVRDLTSKLKDTPLYKWLPAAFLIIIGVHLLVASCFIYHDEWTLVFEGAVACVIGTFLVFFAAKAYADSTIHLSIYGALFISLAVLFAAPPIFIFFDTSNPSIWVILGLFFLYAGVLNIMFTTATSDESPDGVQFRKRLAAARYYFIQELREEKPNLQDAWYPYVIAFGLARDIDRWFQRFGGSTASSAISPGSGGAGGEGGWTGGGGAFGGAGASGSWTSLASSFVSGVSSGGMGGGASGGGGGGGW